MAMARILTLLSLLCLSGSVLCCYDQCIQKFTTEMDKIRASQNVNSTVPMTGNFCKAMSSQISCLHAAMGQCSDQQRVLIQSMLNMFIEPDYYRTCRGIDHNGTAVTQPTGNLPTRYNDMTMGTMGMPRIPFGVPITGHTLSMCTQKVTSCRSHFNQTLTESMANYNVSSICQSLKQYTLCFVNLASSDCRTLVSNNMILSMQNQYRTMCSSDAQANSKTMFECFNKTMLCYSQFNATFGQGLLDYNLVTMCSTIGNYTSCMRELGESEECKAFIHSSNAGIHQLMRRHSASCGTDNGQTAVKCVESFQDCYVPFNETFFPGLHTSNLTTICRSLTTYTSCISRLTPMCSQQMGEVLRSVQALKLQYSEKCHPDILKLTTCKEVGYCSQLFINSFTRMPSGSGLCESIGDYFPCVSRGLDTCKLPQSTTDVEFGALGTLIENYCQKMSNNPLLLRCPAFVKCSTAVMVSFSPNVKNMYEGSTWCTFMQLSIGCAEHALQSTGCFLETNKELQRYITDMDQERMRTCEKTDNLVDSQKQKEGGKGGASSLTNLALTPLLILTSIPLALTRFNVLFE